MAAGVTADPLVAQRLPQVTETDMSGEGFRQGRHTTSSIAPAERDGGFAYPAGLVPLQDFASIVLWLAACEVNTIGSRPATQLSWHSGPHSKRTGSHPTGRRLMAVSFFAFLALVQTVPLSFAVPAWAGTLVLEKALARVVLKEEVCWRKATGAALFLGGIIVIGH